MPSRITAEKLLMSPRGFGLAQASPVQRAICRVADGLPLDELALDANVARALGAGVAANAVEATAALAGYLPDELYIIAAIRCGKSLLSAVLALRSALTCDFSGLMPGEIPVVSILSLTKRLGKFAFRHLLDGLRHGEALRPYLVGEPRFSPDMSLTIRHPSGRLVEVTVVAGAKAGSNLIASWSAGAIFDEAPRMQGSKAGAISFEDARDALADRMCPGAQIVAVGSPWAPSGPVYDVVTEFWGRPSRHIVVVRAPGPVMNPKHWTPERVEKSRTKPNGQRAYRTSCLGEFAEDGGGLLNEIEIDQATRVGAVVVEPEEGWSYFAAMDPATRRNAWALVIVARSHRSLPAGQASIRVVYARQWEPSADRPLEAEVVMSDVAEACRTYGIGEVFTDQWSSDAIAALGRTKGIGIVVKRDEATERERTLQATAARDLVQRKQIELAPEPYLRKDLLGTRLLVTRTGLKPDFLHTSDGRHCDFAPALFIAVDKASHGSTWRAYAQASAEREEEKARRETEERDSRRDPDRRDLARARTGLVFCEACRQNYVGGCTKHTEAA